MRNTVLFLFLISFSLSACSKDKNIYSLLSPDSSIQLEFKQVVNPDSTYQMGYEVFKNGEKVIAFSKLGLEFSDSYTIKSFSKVINIIEDTNLDSWETVWGENKMIEDHYNLMELILETDKNNKPIQFHLYFKLYNDGLGFRYEVPEQQYFDEKVLLDELTEFRPLNVEKTWWIVADFDSYEKVYSTTDLDSVKWVATPFTFKDKKGRYLSIHEANLTDYAGMSLKQTENGVLKAELAPWSNGDKVRFENSLISPWRVILLTDNASALISSNTILNLNEPNNFDDVSWIKPMTYMGVWWSLHLGVKTWVAGMKHGATTERAIEYIDFAAENNVGGVLFEGWNEGWDKWGEKDAFDHITASYDFDLKKVAEYSAQKGVALIGHNETGGDIESYERLMPKAFELYEKLSIHAVKTGYAGGIYPRGENHHGQMMVRHYRKVVELAAKHKIMIDAHEPIKATGIRRTYPNMMTREGVRGMEWNAWSKGNSPEHTLIIPFTRGLGGPIDYTPGIFDVGLKKFSWQRDNWNGADVPETRVKTTLVKQLALMVTLYSPLQMAADMLENYKGEEAFEFISNLKTSFDESIVLNAEIGEYLTIARRSGQDWFIGSTTNEEKRDFEFTLDFLEIGNTYQVLIVRDADGITWLDNPSKYVVERMEVVKGQKLKANLAPGGGFVAYIKKL